MSNIPMPDGFVDDPSLMGEVEDPFGPQSMISALDDPQAANDATIAALDAANPHPVMRVPTNGVVELPGGWRAPDGTVVTSAVVRELNGRDEEKLARIDPFVNTTLYLNTLIELGVERIGDIDDIKTILPQLLVGDREALVLGVRIATYGDEQEEMIVCPACGAEERIKLELSTDVPVRKLDVPGQYEYDVELRQGRIAHVSLPTVSVQDEVLAATTLNAGEATTLTLERCLRMLDGMPVMKDDILNLGIVDRRQIIRFLGETQPGPDYGGVRLPCMKCEEEIQVTLDLADFFR